MALKKCNANCRNIQIKNRTTFLGVPLLPEYFHLFQCIAFLTFFQLIFFCSFLIPCYFIYVLAISTYSLKKYIYIPHVFLSRVLQTLNY